jgi:hypothetical protein
MSAPVGTLTSFAPQGSEEWHAVRKGRITGSRAKDAAERTQKGMFGSKARLYSKDVARSRCGGTVWRKFESKPMTTGKTEEELARMAYEVRTGYQVDEVGFIYTEDGWWGCSPDGLIVLANGERGGIEVKTMVGSENLFDAMVYEDLSEFIDQVHFEIQLAKLDWIDVILWAPDFEGPARMKIIRVTRDQARIAALFSVLDEFRQEVELLEADLRNYLGSFKHTDVDEVEQLVGADPHAELPTSLF